MKPGGAASEWSYTDTLAICILAASLAAIALCFGAYLWVIGRVSFVPDYFGG